MARRRSKWTQIYWDIDPEAPEGQRLRPYVRLIPMFMGVEAEGFPHGLGLAGFFPDEKAANRFADRIDAFMDALLEDHAEFLKDEDHPSYVEWLKGEPDV